MSPSFGLWPPGSALERRPGGRLLPGHPCIELARSTAMRTPGPTRTDRAMTPNSARAEEEIMPNRKSPREPSAEPIRGRLLAAR